ALPGRTATTPSRMHARFMERMVPPLTVRESPSGDALYPWITPVKGPVKGRPNRQSQLEHGPAAGREKLHGPVVSLRDRSSERQAKAQSTASPGCVTAREPLEQGRNDLGGDAGSVVDDAYTRHARLGGDADGHLFARISDRIVEEVLHRARKQQRVPVHRAALAGILDAHLIGSRLPRPLEDASDARLDDLLQPGGGLAGQERSRVRARQGKQSFEQLHQLLAFGFHRPQRGTQLLDGALPA